MSPEQTEKRVFTTEVITFEENRFVRKQKTLVYPGKDSPNGVGDFIDRKAYDAYIHQTYAEDIAFLQQDINTTAVSEDLMFFELGKTVIQLILAQEGCEGIRLTQIDVQKEGKLQRSFIVQGITGQMHREGVARAVQGPDKAGGTMSEEVHGSNLRKVFNIIKGNKFGNESVSVTDVTDALWNGATGK